VDPPTRVVFSSEVRQHFSSDARQHFPEHAQRRSTDGRATLELPENLPQLPPAIDLQHAISNRHTGRLESVVTRSKQTTAPRSNVLIVTFLQV
jgi:hypothetical protein